MTWAPSRRVPSRSTAGTQCFLLDKAQRVADPFVNLVSDRILGVGVDDYLHEPVARPGSISADHHRAGHAVRVITRTVTGPVLEWQRGDRLAEQRDVIVAVVRARVPGAQHRREGF